MDDRKDGDEALAAALRAASRSAEFLASDSDPHPDDAIFASYVSGRLEPRERELFELHVAACDRCAEDLANVALVESSPAADVAPTRGSVSEAAPRSTGVGDAWRRRPSGAAPVRPERPLDRRRGRSRTGKVARRLSIAAVAVLVLTMGILAGGDLLLDRMAPTAAAQLTAALGRPVTIGDLSLAFVPGPALRVSDLHVPDDPRFSSGDIVALGSADLAVEPGSLWRGRVYGSVRLHRPMLRLVRDPLGEWNVETLGGEPSADGGALEPADAALPGGEGTPPSDVKVRLVSASITSGTLAVTDRSGGRDRELVLRDVDLDYRSPGVSEPSTVSLEGEIGGRAVVLRGQIGPFEGPSAPRYRFAEVSLADVDLAELPGAPAAVTGRMTFAGRLEGTGRSLGAIVQTATGGGSLDLCCGALAQRNLDRDLVAALESVAGAAGRLAGTLAGDPGAAAVLAAAATDYRRLGGEVQIDAARLAFSDLGVQTRLFAATTGGALTREGRIDASGRVTLGPELTRALIAAAPALGAILERRGEGDDAIALPFALAGRWPDVKLQIDVDSALRTAALGIDPRRLAWLRLPLAPARG